MMVHIETESKHEIKVLYINALYWGGGAEKIARQLYSGVKEYGFACYFISGRYQENVPREVKVIYNSFFERAVSVLAAIPNHNFLYRTRIARREIINFIKKEGIDIVHFHNMHGNYFGPEDIDGIRKACPNIMVTMHDMWMLTGCCPHGMKCEGWHYGEDCRKCYGNEWLKHGVKNADKYLLCKMNSYSNKNILFVSPSKWLAECCNKSYLKNEKIQVIPNGVNTTVYHPLDKGKLRDKYGIASKKHIIMIAANNVKHPYKGFQYLQQALNRINNKENYCLLVVGNDIKEIQDMGYQIFSPGYISDEKIMNEMYALSDVFVSVSIADNFPLVVLESMAAGTPVIAFRTGGIPEIVSKEVGWLVEQRDVDSLTNTIEKVFIDDTEYIRKQMKCREYIMNNFSEELMLRKYTELYQELYEASV